MVAVALAADAEPEESHPIRAHRFEGWAYFPARESWMRPRAWARVRGYRIGRRGSKRIVIQSAEIVCDSGATELTFPASESRPFRFWAATGVLAQYLPQDRAWRLERGGGGPTAEELERYRLRRSAQRWLSAAVCLDPSNFCV